MRRLFISPFLISFLLLSIFIVKVRSPRATYAQSALTSTSTNEPLAEPFVPNNPTELELGRNWYWHYCMPCHGDVGQGLTDEFRGIWPEEHQNCWARGCHVGRKEDTGFPIPTIVPALVSENQLSQFHSEQALFEYLKSTHPPQDPGYLEDKIYIAISHYVFSMNNRLLEKPTPIPTSTLALLLTPSPLGDISQNKTEQPNSILYIVSGILLVIIVIRMSQNFLKKNR